MLENIHIQNFRCFEDFKAEGFERINLIGGKNNSGKTCLLEGINLLGFNVVIANYGEFINSRKSNNTHNQDNDSTTNLFYNKLIKKPILIRACEDNYTTLDFGISGNFVHLRNDKSIFLKDTWKSKLIFDKYNSIPKINDLSIEYSKAHRKGNGDLILKALQLIDNNIIEINTYPDTPVLHLTVKKSKIPLPINYFGDAIQKMLSYITAFADFDKENKNNYILIDEIENGLHYSAHYEFWKRIFKLSKELNVQVFATTHSLEMIQQFNKVAIEEGGAAYFEMSREYETGKIFAQKHDMELLEYELEKSTSTVRG